MDGELLSYHLLQLLGQQEGVNKMLAFLNLAEVMNVSFRFRCLVQKSCAFTAVLYDTIDLIACVRFSLWMKGQKSQQQRFEEQQIAKDQGWGVNGNYTLHITLSTRSAICYLHVYCESTQQGRDLSQILIGV